MRTTISLNRFLTMQIMVNRVRISDAAQNAKQAKQLHIILSRTNSQSSVLIYIWHTQHVRLYYSETNHTYCDYSTRMPVSIYSMKAFIANWAHCRYHFKNGKSYVPHCKWYWV